MHLVIGTGQPRNLDFAIVTGRDEMPEGAHIYAIFSGAYAFEQLDEDIFNAMTDEEYFTFRALAQDAREREARSRRVGTNICAESLLSKLRSWLLHPRLSVYSSGS